MDTPEINISPRTAEITVYIFNMSEDVWPFIAAMSDGLARKAEIEENADLADRDLFSFCSEDNVIMVMPRAINPEFLEYFFGVFGRKNFQILVPRKHTGIICEDILADKFVFDSLVAAANGSRRLVVRSYSTSHPFLSLIQKLKSCGLTVFTPDAPEEEDAWTVNFYGSKSGIRQLAQQSRAMEPDLVMPDGVIASGIIDASRIAAKKYIKEHGVVLKTNKGHSGAGVLLLREGELPDEYTSCQAAILKLLEKDDYWDLFPIIIESFIVMSPMIAGGSPNVEFRILKNGHVDFLFYGGMRISPQGVFKGMEISNEVVSTQLAARLVDTGFFIAEQYRAAGYRGYFDVDFVAAKNGQVYVTESNVRRTGGTHVYAVAEKLFGKDFMYLTYILSNNSYDLSDSNRFSFAQIREKLQAILFRKETSEGLVIISENLLAYHKLAYIIFAANKKRAYEIEAEMERLLTSVDQNLV